MPPPVLALISVHPITPIAVATSLSPVISTLVRVDCFTVLAPANVMCAFQIVPVEVVRTGDADVSAVGEASVTRSRGSVIAVAHVHFTFTIFKMVTVIARFAHVRTVLGTRRLGNGGTVLATTGVSHASLRRPVITGVTVAADMVVITSAVR